MTAAAPAFPAPATAALPCPAGALRPPRAAGSPLDRPLVLALLAVVGVLGVDAPSALLPVVRDLALPDTDDAMRLVAVRDLVAGQGWFDLVQHRHGPPAGVLSHWSRLVDAPLAGLVLLLAPLAGARLAEGLAAALVPAAVFALYAAALVRAVRARFGTRAACLAVFAAGQTGAVIVNFPFGRVDHHAWQAVIAFGIGLCLMRPGRRATHGALAGVLGALALAVGLEALPFVVAAGLFVAAEWVLAGRPALAFLRAFGLALGAGAAALFALQTAPALWSATACDALSPPWLWLAGTGTLAAAAATVAGDRLAGPAARAGLLAGVALLGAAGFAHLFPACLAGPFAALPDLVRTEWLERVTEAQPFLTRLRLVPAQALGFVAPVLVAALLAGGLAWRGAPAHRRTFGVAALFLAPGALLALVQIRGVYVCAGFVPLVAGVALDRAVAALREADAPAWRRAGLLALAFACLGRAWVAAVELPRAVLPGEAAGEAAGALGEAREACARPGSVAALDRLPAGTVLAPIDFGPAILLHTHHAVVAAPYHRGVAGLSAGILAFGGDEAAARREAAATGATYLVACPGAPERSLDAQPPFAARLARGEVSPAWLAPLPLPDTALRAWRVVDPGPAGARP